jgi:hypothetical protein
MTICTAGELARPAKYPASLANAENNTLAALSISRMQHAQHYTSTSITALWKMEKATQGHFAFDVCREHSVW